MPWSNLAPTASPCSARKAATAMKSGPDPTPSWRAHTQRQSRALDSAQPGKRTARSTHRLPSSKNTHVGGCDSLWASILEAEKTHLTGEMCCVHCNWSSSLYVRERLSFYTLLGVHAYNLIRRQLYSEQWLCCINV